MEPRPAPDPATLLDLMADTLFVLDAHGLLLFASPSCERLLGYRPDELVGQYMIEYVHPDDRGHTLNAVWRIMAGQAPGRFENRWRHKDGHDVPIQWAARWSPEHQVRVAVARQVLAAAD
jgi:PAS domain S-box-containing protein